MQPLGVLLLLLTCQLATSIPIFDRDDAGLHSRYRSAGFGETIRDWFRMLKNRVVGKWREWFGNDGPTPSFTPEDIFNIDKTIGNRVPGYPGLFLDLSSISFDPKQDWGVRVGNWYIIRKVTGNNYSPDSDSDEWDMRPLMPNLPSIFGIDWTPNIHEFEIPEVTQLPKTTPKIDSTTSRREQTSPTVTQIKPVSTESTVIVAEPIPLTTQLIAASTEPIATSTEEILTSTESITINGESATISTESILTSTETITEVSTVPIVPSTEPAVTSTESIIPSIERTLNSTESIVTSIESTTITESIATSTEEIVTSTTAELPDRMSTELILPVFNKKIEDNETVNTHTTKKPRSASAEVIMF